MAAVCRWNQRLARFPAVRWPNGLVKKENPGGSALHAARGCHGPCHRRNRVRWGRIDAVSCRRSLLPPVTGERELECAHCPGWACALVWCDRTIVLSARHHPNLGRFCDNLRKLAHDRLERDKGLGGAAGAVGLYPALRWTTSSASSQRSTFSSRALGLMGLDR